MKPEIKEMHIKDKDDNPTGGTTCAEGMDIRWQDGPLGQGDARQKKNGTFVEDVIAAAIGRLQFYQQSKFACHYNKDAIYHLEQAMLALNARTEDRMARGVEGTHQE